MHPGLFYAVHAVHHRPVTPPPAPVRPLPRVEKPQASARDRATTTRWSLLRWHSSRASA